MRQGKANGATDIQRVALIVVERPKIEMLEKSVRPPVIGTASLGDLIRIRQVNLRSMCNAGRSQCDFPSVNDRPCSIVIGKKRLDSPITS